MHIAETQAEYQKRGKAHAPLEGMWLEVSEVVNDKTRTAGMLLSGNCSLGEIFIPTTTAWGHLFYLLWVCS